MYHAPAEMARKIVNTRKNVRRLKAHTRVIQATNRALFAVILLCLAVGFFVSYLPQKKQLLTLQQQLASTLEREAQSKEFLENIEITLESLKNDPTYLEIQARDRLPWYRPGETIFRIERE
jgi:cell division protein FtsB